MMNVGGSKMRFVAFAPPPLSHQFPFVVRAASPEDQGPPDKTPLRFGKRQGFCPSVHRIGGDESICWSGRGDGFQRRKQGGPPPREYRGDESSLPDSISVGSHAIDSER